MCTNAVFVQLFRLVIFYRNCVDQILESQKIVRNKSNTRAGIPHHFLYLRIQCCLLYHCRQCFLIEYQINEQKNSI